MIDGHIHIEQGDYTLEWISRFVDRAAEMQLQEIRLLEHCYLFKEFVPMYSSVCNASQYVDTWFHKRAGRRTLAEYFRLMEQVRGQNYPVKVKLGLEICYFREHEQLIAELTKGGEFDFLLGSIHFVDNFAYDLKAEHWIGVDVDSVYRRYFEDSVSLARSGLFDGIGHPDAIKLYGYRPTFSLSDSYEALAEALAKSRMYADENSGVARRCPQAPSLGIDREFLHILKKHNVIIITSSDAHCPEDVGYRIAELEKCVADA